MPYNIQGNTVSLANEPFLHGNNKHYVPLRDLAEALDGKVAFNNDTKMATVAIGQWTANVAMADTNVTVVGTDGQNVPVSLTGEPFVRDGQMYVPFDFFRDAFGYDVSLTGDTVVVKNPNAT